MATWLYSGRVSDFGEAHFLNAIPRVWVQAQRDAFSPAGQLAQQRRVPINLQGDGTFTVALVASTDTTPPTRYTLYCEWFTTTVSGVEVPAGWASWDFTAVAGGGPISDMVDAPLSVWFVGPPWPPTLPPGFYFDRETNDVGRRA